MARVKPSLAHIVADLRRLARPIAEMRLDPKNARRHNELSVSRVRASLAKHGQQKPVVLDADGRTVIAGNATLQAARQMGWTHLAAVRSPLKGSGALAYALDDNRTPELSSWNGPALVGILTELRAAGTEPVGWSPAEITELLQRAAAPDEEPDTPERPRKPESKAGKIYDLGPHKLLCGSATDAKAIAKLMGGEQAAVVYTDPPYGVDYQGGKHGRIEGDARQRDQLSRFLIDTLGLAVRHAQDDAAFYIWHASATRADFVAALAAVGLEERQYLIWEKPAPTMGWADYLWAHEPCFYASKSGQSPRFLGPRGQPTVFRLSARTGKDIATLIGTVGVLISDGDGIELYITAQSPKGKKPRHVRVPADGGVLLRPQQDRDDLWAVARESKAEHPTQKPMELARRAITNSSAAGEIILDLFGGSGNALLAADATGRRARLVEIDPGYCDVIRRRYAIWVADQEARRHH